MRHLKLITNLFPCFSLCLAMACLWGCSDELTVENDRLRDRIIEVHDEAMEKIGYMYQLEVKLRSIEDLDDHHRQPVEQAATQLELANKMMFDWMHQYQPLAVDDDLRIDTSYRKKQLQLIEEVGLITNTSIAMAETLLKGKDGE